MICVHKVWKFIGNNYDVTGKPEKDDILVFGAGFGRLYFWRTIHIYINPSKLLTELAALKLVDYIKNEIDGKSTLVNIYIDLSKAFDTVVNS